MQCQIVTILRTDPAGMPCNALLLGWTAFPGLVVKRLGLQLPVVLQQDLNLAFRRLQFASTGSGEGYAFFKQRQGFFQRKLTLFQFINNLFQALKTLLELGQDSTPIVL